MRCIKNKICVVTGAAKSIGLEISREFAKKNAVVLMLDLDPAVIEEATKLKALGYSAFGYCVDISNRDMVLDLFKGFENEHGDIDILVNNAGIVDQRPFTDITEELINKQMQVNVNGTLFCMQGAAISMMRNKEGRIINFSSKSGKTGSALMAHYSAAKGAVISLTQAVAFELAPYNIKVNSLCPGITNNSGVWKIVSSSYKENLKLTQEEVERKFTAKIPLGRLTNIEDIVDFVMFLAVSGNYCTGQSFNISGGRETH